MPAASITTTAQPAFRVPQGTFGFRLRNTSDTTIYWRDSADVATSGNNMGMPLDPGQEHIECYQYDVKNPRAIQMVHGGTGSKSIAYDFLQTPVNAVAGTAIAATVTVSAGDIQIGAVELKNGGDDTRADIGAGSGLSKSSNALAVGGQVGGYTITPSANFTRPADTTAYASGDLVANSTTAGSVTPLSFAIGRIAAGSFVIRKARLKKSGTSTTNASFRLHLYTSTPGTITNGDNGAWSTSHSGYVGSLDFSSSDALAFTDAAAINGTPVKGSEISVKLASGTTLYGLLEARAAYTPADAEVFTVELEAFQD